MFRALNCIETLISPKLTTCFLFFIATYVELWQGSLKVMPEYQPEDIGGTVGESVQTMSQIGRNQKLQQW